MAQTISGAFSTSSNLPRLQLGIRATPFCSAVEHNRKCPRRDFSMQRKNQMLESTRNREAAAGMVNTILFQQWDPIGLPDLPEAPRDEYSTYALTILGMLANGDRAAAIASYLVDMEERRMGLTPNAARAQSVAQSLVHMWDVRLVHSS